MSCRDHEGAGKFIMMQWDGKKFQQFGIFYDAAALPWNADIDPRTMEILSSGTGAPSVDGKTVTPDTIEKKANEWLEFLKTYSAE